MGHKVISWLFCINFLESSGPLPCFVPTVCLLLILQFLIMQQSFLHREQKHKNLISVLKLIIHEWTCSAGCCFFFIFYSFPYLQQRQVCFFVIIPVTTGGKSKSTEFTVLHFPWRCNSDILLTFIEHLFWCLNNECLCVASSYYSVLTVCYLSVLSSDPGVRPPSEIWVGGFSLLSHWCYLLSGEIIPCV